jgi:hypothetical protein
MIPGWKEEADAEYLRLLQASPTASPGDLATSLGVSECCVVYWLTQLARNGRIRITSVEVVKEGEAPCAERSFLTCQRKATCPALTHDAAWPAGAAQGGPDEKRPHGQGAGPNVDR